MMSHSLMGESVCSISQIMAGTYFNIRTSNNATTCFLWFNEDHIESDEGPYKALS